MNRSLKTLGILVGMTLLVVAIDQSVKGLVVGAFSPGESYPLLPGVLQLRYEQNTGVAFSMFHRSSPLVVILLNLLVLGIFLGLILPFLRSRCSYAAMILLLGGAFGNLIDRIRLHYVIDFLDFHIWPVFNIADIAIVLGVGLFALTLLTAKHDTPTSRGEHA